MVETKLWWIRHAPIIATGRYTGQSDVDAQLPDITVALDVPADALWFSSPLKRAQQTAQWLRASPVIVPALQEQSFGAWEGRFYDEVWQEAEHAHDWSKPELIAPENGESFSDVCVRVALWLDAALVEYAGRNIVAVAHAGTIRAALAHALRLSPAEALSQEVECLSVSHVTYDGAGKLNYSNKRLAE